MTRWIACFVIVALATVSGSAQAKEPFCVELKEELIGMKFVAKVPLYDTKIGYDMIYYLERDDEEIREGEEFTVEDVDCDKKDLEMTLEPLRKGDDVEVIFLLSRDERAAADARERLEQMMDHVFEDPDQDE